MTKQTYVSDWWPCTNFSAWHSVSGCGCVSIIVSPQMCRGLQSNICAHGPVSVCNGVPWQWHLYQEKGWKKNLSWPLLFSKRIWSCSILLPCIRDWKSPLCLCKGVLYAWISLVKPVSWSFHQCFSLGVSVAVWINSRGFTWVCFCLEPLVWGGLCLGTSCSR